LREVTVGERGNLATVLADCLPGQP
jgi:hypothetical protein